MVKSTPNKTDSKKAEGKAVEQHLDPSSRGVSKKAETSSNKGPIGFLRATREELDKVVWPTRSKLISESAAVFGIVVISAMFIFAIDQVFTWIAERLFT